MRQEAGFLTLLVLPGDGGLGASHRQAEQVDVVALVHRHVSGNVDDSRRHWETREPPLTPPIRSEGIIHEVCRTCSKTRRWCLEQEAGRAKSVD